MNDKSIQFELWQQCNNYCEFCYLGTGNRYVSDEIKLANIERVSKLIDNYLLSSTEKFKAIGLIGGEFFQGQLNNPIVKNSFFKLCEKIFIAINEDKISDFWCYCTLTLGEQSDLYTLLDLFAALVDTNKHSFWIQASYDAKGRFNHISKLINWHKHLYNLQKYPFVKFNITSILTEAFLQDVLSNKFNFKDFQRVYKNTFFLKQPTFTADLEKQELLQRLPWFFPKRKTYISFLKKVKLENPEIFDEILNINLRSNIMHGQLDEGNLLPQIRDKTTWEEYIPNAENEPHLHCGHELYYACYSDSNACCLCDYIKVKNGI